MLKNKEKTSVWSLLTSERRTDQSAHSSASHATTNEAEPPPPPRSSPRHVIGRPHGEKLKKYKKHEKEKNKTAFNTKTTNVTVW